MALPDGAGSQDLALFGSIPNSSATIGGELLVNTHMSMYSLKGNGKAIVLVLVGLALAGLVWWAFTRKAGGPVDIPEPGVEQPKSVDVGGKLTEPEKNLFDNLSQAKNYSTFLTATQTTGLTPLLQSGQKITIFAPDNAAFGKLSREAVQTLFKPENKERLKELLNYHIVPGKHLTKDFKDGLRLKTVQGNELTFTKKDDRWWINGTVLIQTPDVASINGVMHGVDAVVTSPVK